MTGEDTAQTGGTFLIEKGPDPSALWQRPSDPHSEWGAGQVDPATVRTNPYEGGSDRTVFTNTGVPALLNWHFTDRYYHTVATTALYLSAAGVGEVMPMTRLMEAARDARMATEKTNNATPEILGAWRKWYTEAIESVSRLR